jgi:hypothetical protein
MGDGGVARGYPVVVYWFGGHEADVDGGGGPNLRLCLAKVGMKW